MRVGCSVFTCVTAAFPLLVARAKARSRMGRRGSAGGSGRNKYSGCFSDAK